VRNRKPEDFGDLKMPQDSPMPPFRRAALMAKRYKLNEIITGIVTPELLEDLRVNAVYYEQERQKKLARIRDAAAIAEAHDYASPTELATLYRSTDSVYLKVYLLLNPNLPHEFALEALHGDVPHLADMAVRFANLTKEDLLGAVRTGDWLVSVAAERRLARLDPNFIPSDEDLEPL
jgi:hypothetical protein